MNEHTQLGQFVRWIFGPLTTTRQSFDGRRTLNNRGAIYFVLLVIATFVTRSHLLGAVLFLLLFGGGLLGAGLTARDFKRGRR